MIAENVSSDHNRTIVFKDLPILEGMTLPSLTITVNYDGDGDSDVHKGITLDNVVIPAIILAVNNHVALNERVTRLQSWRDKTPYPSIRLDENTDKGWHLATNEPKAL